MPIKLKLGGGVDIRLLNFFFDWRSIRELRFSEFQGAGWFTDYTFTAGVSEMVAAGLTVSGSQGGILDQLGLHIPNGDVAGCLSGVCLGVEGQFDTALQPQGVAYFAGAGQGFDVSAGASVTDLFLFTNADADALAAKIPIPLPFAPFNKVYSIPWATILGR